MFTWKVHLFQRSVTEKGSSDRIMKSTPMEKTTQRISALFSFLFFQEYELHYPI